VTVCLRLWKLNRSGLPCVGPGRRWVTWPDRFWFLTTKVANWSGKKNQILISWVNHARYLDSENGNILRESGSTVSPIKIIYCWWWWINIFFNRSWVKPTVVHLAQWDHSLQLHCTPLDPLTKTVRMNVSECPCPWASSATWCRIGGFSAVPFVLEAWSWTQNNAELECGKYIQKGQWHMKMLRRNGNNLTNKTKEIQKG